MATYNGTTLSIDIPLTAGAVIPSEGAPDVAGVAVIGNTMYCVKTSGTKTFLYKVTDYDNSSARAAAVTKDIDWRINGVKQPCRAIGLTKVGNYLYLLAANKSDNTGSTVILKLNTSGAVLDSYDISSIVPDGARGITAENGTDEKFIVMNYDMVYDHKPAFKFNVVQWGRSTHLKRFRVPKDGYGCANAYDIYLHSTYGLFIVTADEEATCRNKIVVTEYRSADGSGMEYIPKTVLGVKGNTQTYSQYTLKSVCMKANHLVLGMDIQNKTEGVKDRFAVAEAVTYTNVIYTFAPPLQEGTVIPNDITYNGVTATNLGCMSFKEENIPYFVKQGENTLAVLGKAANYANASGSYDPLKRFTEGELGHANGMTCYNGKFYIAAAQDDKVVAINADKLEIERTYTIAGERGSRVMALNHYRNNQCLLFSPHNDGDRYKLHTCVFGTSTQVNAQFLGILKNPFAGQGLKVSQDIFYHEAYGLFVGICNANVVGKGITTKNILLHYDLKKLTADSMLLPDFGWVSDMPANNSQGETYHSYEIESMALDESTGKMAAVFNTNVSDSSQDLHSRDRFMVYRTIDFV